MLSPLPHHLLFLTISPPISFHYLIKFRFHYIFHFCSPSHQVSLPSSLFVIFVFIFIPYSNSFTSSAFYYFARSSFSLEVWNVAVTGASDVCSYIFEASLAFISYLIVPIDFSDKGRRRVPECFARPLFDSVLHGFPVNPCTAGYCADHHHQHWSDRQLPYLFSSILTRFSSADLRLIFSVA